MKNISFNKLLIGIIVVCLVLTLIHLAYDVYAYRHCSIIYFIAKELY